MQERLLKFAVSRTLRLETQWNAFAMFQPVIHEEARVLGLEIDALVAPLSLSLKDHLPKISTALVTAANSAVAMLGETARRFSGE
jgi:hypothetical protein